MTGWFRFAVVYIRRTLRPKKCGFYEEASADFRVWPQDADLKIMNNARYATVLEAARFDFLIRLGFLKLLTLGGVQLLIGSVFIQYRKPLRRFQKFTIRTRVVYFEGPWIYLQQRIDRQGILIAQSCLPFLAMKNGVKLEATELLRLAGIPIVESPMPEAVRKLKELNSALPKT